ncbi:MAG: hypothetical protein C4518_08200 [Desulfobacteraceae bacterium]|nr:MAG: hypothetical protein C4518_08200 [Desulfobacteraceae bacterium]
MDENKKWIMLVYKPPKARTSAVKVALWRKLKKLGVYQLQDAVCVLPFSEKNHENFQWTAAELVETGGEASLWLTSSLSPEKEREIYSFFIDQSNDQYKKLMIELSKITSEMDLRKLWTLYHRIKAQDYLKSPLCVEVKAAFEKRREILNKTETEK